MAFLETPRFPDGIGAGSTGGPGYNTAIVTYGNGNELRSPLQSLPLHAYNAANAIQTLDELYTLQQFFHVSLGRYNGFRYKDWLDYKSCAPSSAVSALDCPTLQLTPTTFQLQKQYQIGDATQVRPILKPVAGTVLIAVSGVTVGAGWTVDTTTGIVTFASTPDAVPTAGFEFDVPVRFNVDRPDINLQTWQIGGLNVPIVELSNPFL